VRELDPLTFLVAESLMGVQGAEKSVKRAVADAVGRAGQAAGQAEDGLCLVLLAHGSKDPRWRAPFERMVCELEQELGKGKVRLAYMEFTGPTLMDVACECVGQSLLNLRVLPLFMAVGAHLIHDIPEQVEAIRGRFPQTTVKVLAPIGEDGRLVRLIEQIAVEAAQA
jgi:sirohydrochlorin cobaltochelatase